MAQFWFGWYGFNAGSAFGANAIAGVAFLTTTVAAAVATITWLAIEALVFKKPTLLGAASGAIAGLVAITPAAGFVSVGGALIIGIVGSFVGFFGVAVLKKKLGYDDSLDAFGGSGSTLIAAEQTKRKARLIELDPKYCDVIVKRWENLTGLKAELVNASRQTI